MTTLSQDTYLNEDNFISGIGGGAGGVTSIAIGSGSATGAVTFAATGTTNIDLSGSTITFSSHSLSGTYGQYPLPTASPSFTSQADGSLTPGQNFATNEVANLFLGPVHPFTGIIWLDGVITVTGAAAPGGGNATGTFQVTLNNTATDNAYATLYIPFSVPTTGSTYVLVPMLSAPLIDSLTVGTDNPTVAVQVKLLTSGTYAGANPATSISYTQDTTTFIMGSTFASNMSKIVPPGPLAPQTPMFDSGTTTSTVLGCYFYRQPNPPPGVVYTVLYGTTPTTCTSVYTPAAGGPDPVNCLIPGLTPSTAYYVIAVATQEGNSNNSPTAGPFSTAAAV